MNMLYLHRDRLEEPFKDKQPHLYTLILRPDNTYTIKVDHRIVNEGSLLADFTPAVNPPKDIDDPSDTKPVDWDEREKINDPIAQKPEDWNEDAPPQIPDEGTSKPDGWLDDEETMISDPTAVKPDDWDTDMDGDWEAPLITNPICEKAVGCGLWKAPFIANPNYRGKWRAPLIDNPNYQGKWAPRSIPNPNFFEDLQPFKMTPIVRKHVKSTVEILVITYFIFNSFRLLLVLNCGLFRETFYSTISSSPIVKRLLSSGQHNHTI